MCNCGCRTSTPTESILPHRTIIKMLLGLYEQKYTIIPKETIGVAFRAPVMPMGFNPGLDSVVR